MRPWFTMKAEDTTAEIIIYDEIGRSFWGEETVTAKQFVDDLAALGDVSTITLRINSPGGDVFDGLAIHNAIKNHKATVTAQVDGLAASAASFIAMAADKIVMPSNAFMLIHGASGFAMGQADDMRAMAADLDRIDKSMMATYAARSGQSSAKVKALMHEDRLMDAAEAKELGYADLITAPVKMAAKFSLHLLPKAAAEAFRAATGTEQGDPPRAAPASEGPEVQPAVPPVPPRKDEPHEDEPAEEEEDQPAEEEEPVETVTAKVIDLKAAKAQGIAEHQAYVVSVTDLCTLARAPERVGGYVRAGTTIEQVRKELLAKAGEEPTVSPHHPLIAPAPPAKAWDKITDKLNARLKK